MRLIHCACATTTSIPGTEHHQLPEVPKRKDLRFLDAAAKAFSAGGYHTVRLEDIADAVGSGAADLAEATTRVHLHHAFHHLTRRGRAEGISAAGA